jgi:hypothetical protein
VTCFLINDVDYLSKTTRAFCRKWDRVEGEMFAMSLDVRWRQVGGVV